MGNILGETIKLDGNNDRADYECLLSQIDNTRKSEYVIPKRILKFGKNKSVDTVTPTNKLLEIKYKNEVLKYAKTKHNQTLDYVIPKNIDTQWKRTDNSPAMPIKEDVPLAFYCAEGCGGSQINLTHWQNGECIWNAKSRCRCIPGYSEASNCKIPICDGCKPEAGKCVSPKNCSCHRGWKNTNSSISDCAISHCNKK